MACAVPSVRGSARKNYLCGTFFDALIESILHDKHKRTNTPCRYTSEQCQKLTSDNGGLSPMSRSSNVWENAAIESFFSLLRTERIVKKVYLSRDDQTADLFDYIESFYNPVRRQSNIGYISPVEFENKAGSA